MNLSSFRLFPCLTVRRPKRFKREIIVRAFDPWFRKGSRFLVESMQGSCSDAIILDVLRHLLAAS